jgi:hypothetical protein
VFKDFFSDIAHIIAAGGFLFLDHKENPELHHDVI